MFKKIANTEKEYITSGCQYEVRSDGRENKNIRPISAEYNIFPHTNGSSRIRIGNSTDVTCSVRVEVIDLNLKLHDQGQMEVNIDISPCCHIGLDDRRISENTQIIANQLQRFYEDDKVFDYETLCIIPGKYCWMVYIDILVFQYDCDLMQVSSLAAYVALNKTLIPKVELFTDESGKISDFDIDGDPLTARFLPCQNMPICIVSYKIGSSIVFDATSDEQASSSCRFTLATNQHNLYCGFLKQNEGSFSLDELPSILQISNQIAMTIFNQLKDGGKNRQGQGLISLFEADDSIEPSLFKHFVKS